MGQWKQKLIKWDETVETTIHDLIDNMQKDGLSLDNAIQLLQDHVEAAECHLEWTEELEQEKDNGKESVLFY